MAGSIKDIDENQHSQDKGYTLLRFKQHDLDFINTYGVKIPDGKGGTYIVLPLIKIFEPHESFFEEVPSFNHLPTEVKSAYNKMMLDRISRIETTIKNFKQST